MSTVSCLLPAIDRTTFAGKLAPRYSITGTKTHRVSKHQRNIRATALHDYFQQTTYLLTKSDGGPPRWFSPLECGSRFDNSPLLLTLPGIDGNGHALLLHYKRLGQIFDIWCLHIPTTDRTPFKVGSRFDCHYSQGLADVFTVETILWKLKMVESAYEYSNSHIHSVSAQTLILSSGRDQILLLPNLIDGQRLCQILPKCQMRIFNECGHALFLEEDVDLVTVIKEAGFYHRAALLPPCPIESRKIVDSFSWTDVVTSPVLLSTLENEKIVRGLDGIPTEGPVLFVGNHNMLALEVIPIVRHLIIDQNINVRGLSHPFLFKKFKQVKVPTYDIFQAMGAVSVSPSNMYQLFSMKAHVLLHPGGVREVLHRKGEEYKLFWPKQPEFVRMAAKLGAKIVPFGAVGEDDFIQLVFDYDDQMRIPFFKGCIEALTNEFVKLRTDAEGEVANQDMHVPGLLPKVPGRYYYLFGKPIETQGMKHELRKKEKAEEVYSHVKCEVEKCIDYLVRRREEDPYRNIIARSMYQATCGGLDSPVPTFCID